MGIIPVLVLGVYNDHVATITIGVVQSTPLASFSNTNSSLHDHPHHHHYHHHHFPSTSPLLKEITRHHPNCPLDHYCYSSSNDSKNDLYYNKKDVHISTSVSDRIDYNDGSGDNSEQQPISFYIS
ncbi:hypothetical protein ACTA71_004017 [Dictyostelium dimigraforme]